MEPPTGSAPGLRHSTDSRVRCYRSQFADLMEMRAPSEVVTTYLDRHEGWFRRCAAPMKVAPIGASGYALTLGRFGNFGFEVEPSIGLELLPQRAGVYRIVTVPLAAAEEAELTDLYDVEFNACLRLDDHIDSLDDAPPSPLTQVRWELDLSVWIKLPSLIGLLPEALVQSSGDHLLRQIVRQISRKLTWKVQEDFHASHALDCPPRRRAQF
ncbi:DUF1997 domain-containing protein [Cyanobium sp. Morenito 9A2]|uniref:DUF1997 domain-containing protein n=1 Tax=Cyanobium sp. Morenito 9A2 TaxID=2823718 RepID=UPI0020CD9864|nr:DUF1997 domain-containing protein [Cyanobium sp. Morenito 9A2]MCP9849626.1 DUF1997 domain-containing protein [Cyanobium sp. Morenito 9A2]